MQRQLFIARHAETAESQEAIVQGQSDTRLSEKGRSSARALGDYLGSHHFVSRILSSDLARAAETSELIASLLSTPVPIDFVAELREIACGVFEGNSFDALQKYRQSDGRGPENAVPPGGETIVELRDRVLAWFRAYLPVAKNGSLIVTHRGPLSMILESIATPRGNRVDRTHILPCHLITLSVDESNVATVVDSRSPVAGPGH